MVRRNFGGLSAARARAGFTLVELLVVIIIIAILAAIAVPAVMRATASAQNARIKTEIDMLHQAIMLYKNEYGSFPPCIDLPSGTVDKHVRRIFPRMSGSVDPTTTSGIRPDTSLFMWGSGYNTDNPTNPLAAGPHKKFFDFDTSLVTSNQYAAPSKPNSPYIYIDAAHYAFYDATATAPAGPFGGIYYSHRVPAKAAPKNFSDTNQPYANPDTFQIICAGRDEKFGTDDDMSNFWPGTRGDYIDSLK
jgi:hypothetical protein